VNIPRTFLIRATVLFAVSCVTIAGCGRSSLLTEDFAGNDAGADAEGGSTDVILHIDVVSFDVSPPVETGLPDVLPPPGTCGDHVCNDDETCFTCPEDCGLCPGCGDGRCEGNETCASCAPDCGVCPRCGDGVCTAPGETCFSCPEDCGPCARCGDGICQSTETCASCPADCGPCAVCGNGKCDPFEDCSNCPTDCGTCTTTTCLDVIRCAVSCSNPINLPCITDCLSGACPAALSDATNVITCATTNLSSCGGGFTLACIEKECPGEIAACLNNTCPSGM
jgi:hypothetical protein